MSKVKLFFSLISIIFAVALIGGATLAWFTDTAGPLENVFEAGTVVIEANRESHATKSIVDNWNPGDCTELELKVENEGTKSIYLRSQLWDRWLPSALRVLIIYTEDTIQLLVLEWDSTCKGCTGTDGPIAIGDFRYTSSPGTKSYMNGEFRNLSNDNWISNSSGYHVWCVDSNRTISTGWHNEVEIYDPFCNEDWYLDAGVSHDDWNNIPWAKIVYIINKYDDYVDLGFTIMDIQQAIWRITNPGETSYPSTGIHANYNPGNVNDILDDVEGNYELPTNNVNFDLQGWTESPDGDGWWYYNQAIPGNVNEVINIVLRVCLDGDLTGNEYQGAQYWLTFLFQAIQSSHEAAFDQWGVGLVDGSWIKVTYNEENDRWQTLDGQKFWDGSAWVSSS